jgi:hypothetical protein
MMHETGGDMTMDMRPNDGYGNNGVILWMIDMGS